MATSTTNTLANSYQRYFSKELLKHAIQLTVLDQFGLKQKMPKNKGAKTISFFRRSASTASATTGLVTAVQTLTEGVPINSYTDATLLRVDVPLIQYGEATRITDILSMTELFDALQQNKDMMAEDCALNADSITRNALVNASQGGVSLQTATGNTTEYIAKRYAQNATSFANLQAQSNSGAKITAIDFLDAATQLKLNRAPTWSGYYVAIVPPQISRDLQNDPDWIDAANYGATEKRFKGELGRMYGVRFVEHTNPFIEDGTGTEGVYNGNALAANAIYRTFVLGQGAYGTPSIEGDNAFSPKVMIVDTPDHADPLNQTMIAGWKAFWGASALNCPYAVSISSKTEFIRA